MADASHAKSGPQLARRWWQARRARSVQYSQPSLARRPLFSRGLRLKRLLPIAARYGRDRGGPLAGISRRLRYSKLTARHRAKPRDTTGFGRRGWLPYGLGRHGRSSNAVGGARHPVGRVRHRPHQARSSERCKAAAESDQQQGAIPHVFELVARSVEHEQKVIVEQGLCLLLNARLLPLYASQRCPHEL